MTATSVESMPPDSPMTTSVKPAPRTSAQGVGAGHVHLLGVHRRPFIAKALPRVWQRFVSGRLPACVRLATPTGRHFSGRSTSMESICSSRPTRNSRHERVADRAEAVVEVVLELVAAFQADAARADHRQIQRGALGERVGLGQGLEGEHEGVLHRLGGLADGTFTPRSRVAPPRGPPPPASMTLRSSVPARAFYRPLRRQALVLALDAPTQHTRAMSRLPS